MEHAHLGYLCDPRQTLLICVTQSALVQTPPVYIEVQMRGVEQCGRFDVGDELEAVGVLHTRELRGNPPRQQVFMQCTKVRPRSSVLRPVPQGAAELFRRIALEVSQRARLLKRPDLAQASLTHSLSSLSRFLLICFRVTTA